MNLADPAPAAAGGAAAHATPAGDAALDTTAASARRAPLILFGAFDRHNLGDLLLGRIAAELAARLLHGREGFTARSARHIQRVHIQASPLCLNPALAPQGAA